MPNKILQDKSSQRLLKVAIAVIIAIVFIIDVKTPLGVTSGSAYIFSIFLCYWLKEKRAVYVVGSICVGLLVAGFLISPEGIIAMWVIIFNRFFSLLAILLSATFTNKFRHLTIKHIDNEMMLGAVLTSSSEAIIVIDKNGEIVYLNQSTEYIFGYTVDELKGRKIEVLVPPEIREKHVALRNGYIQDPQVRPMGIGRDLYAVKKDGTRFPVEISLSHFRTGKGFFVTCFINDITLRKDAEFALKQKNQELIESNRILSFTNSDLEQFLYATSHEMQEPLRMVANYAQLLKMKNEEKMDDDSKNYLKFIVDEAKRMKQLIVGVSDYININVQDRQDDDVDLNEVVQDAKAALQDEINSNKAKIIIENKLPVIKGNRHHLHNLFEAFIDNAIKFRSDENPKVVISCRQDDEAWKFSVKDNGISIDPKYKNKIFKIFKKLHLNKEYRGAGVGLAIAKKIVDYHGGDIWFESETGKGTTFCFTLAK